MSDKCKNCGKTFGQHYALRCESGSDESIWKGAEPASDPSEGTPAAAEVARLKQQLANARRDALEEAAQVCGESDGWDMHPKDYYYLIHKLIDKEAK